MNNIINELKDLYDNLTKIKYKPIKNKNIIEIHKYNLNLQEETYNNLISYLNNLIKHIKENNTEEYYDELIKITTTKNKVPTLEELNIANYISFRSINLNKKQAKETNNYYREINEIIDNIKKEKEKQKELQSKQQEKKNKIIELKKKKEKIKEEQHIKLKELKQEKKRIENEIENTKIELNKTFIFNIFKKDLLNSKIDLLNQEYNQYEENIKQLNNDYKIKIDKEELKIEELKKD